MSALELGAQDVEDKGEELEIYCTPTELARLRAGLEELGVSAQSAEVSMVPKTTVQLEGKEAERIGLVNYAVPQQDVMPRAMEIARRLALGAPQAIRWTKYSINKILRDHVNLALDASMFLEAATMSSEDLQEATKAFYEKRQPEFKGR